MNDKRLQTLVQTDRPTMRMDVQWKCSEQAHVVAARYLAMTLKLGDLLNECQCKECIADN